MRNKKFWFNQCFLDDYSFIHINKCGGTSVERFLDIPKVHDTAAHRIKIIGKKNWDNRFTFALIRNPYSKVVSHYNYRTKTNQNNLREMPLSLNDWIKLSYGDKNPAYFDNPLMFEPCYNWLVYDGIIAVECVIKLEEIEKDWFKICDSLKMSRIPLANENRTLKTSIQAAFNQLDDASIAIIHKQFQIDFENFNYEKLSR